MKKIWNEIRYWLCWEFLNLAFSVCPPDEFKTELALFLKKVTSR